MKPAGFALAAAVGVTAATLGVAPRASADVAPPDGSRPVEYAFRLDGQEAFADKVFVAYPWTSSRGAPTTEYVVLASGQSIDYPRRVTSHVYAVDRSSLPALRALPQLTMGPPPPALEAFFKSPRALDCPFPDLPPAGNPPPALRSTVNVFAVKAVGPEGCRLEAVKVVATFDDGHVSETPFAKAPDGALTSTTTPARAGAASRPVPSPTGVHGCGGCTLAARDGGRPALALTLVTLAGVVVRRVHRRRRELARTRKP